MPYTQPSPQPYAPDGTGTARPQVTTFAGPSLIVEIHGEIDIFSAPGLRDELLRVICRYGPQLAPGRRHFSRVATTLITSPSRTAPNR
jgi:hypothetical protein